MWYNLGMHSRLLRKTYFVNRINYISLSFFYKRQYPSSFRKMIDPPESLTVGMIRKAKENKTIVIGVLTVMGVAIGPQFVLGIINASGFLPSGIAKGSW